MLVQTIKNEWLTIRNQIATKDWPSTAGATIDPPDDVTERTVACMVDVLEAVIKPIRCDQHSGINILQLRTTFENVDDTATMCIFAARDKELTVTMIAEIDWAAGAQTTTDSTARFFGATSSITQHWPTTIRENSSEDALGGIATIEFDIRGYNRFWVGFDAISANDNVSVEYSGY